MALRYESLAVGSSVLVASGFAMGRDILLGRLLGIGERLDVWVLAITVIGFATSALVTTITASLTPRYWEAHHRSPDDGRRVAVSAILGAVGAGFGVAGLLLAVVYAFEVGSIPGVEITGALASTLRWMLLTSVPAVFVRAACTSILHAHRRFMAPAFSPALSAAVVAVACAAGVRQTWLLGLTHGIALAVESALLLGYVTRIARLRWPTLVGITAVWRVVATGTAPAFLGALSLSANPFIDLWFAASLGKGNAGLLNMATRVPIAVAGLGAAAIAVPAFPSLVAVSGSDRLPDLASLLRSTITKCAKYGGAMMVATAALSYPVTLVLFSGSRISGEDIVRIASMQALASTVIIPYILTSLLVRVFHARMSYRVPLLVGCAGLATNIVSDWVLATLFGVSGIVAATSIVYVATTTMMWWLLSHETLRGGVPCESTPEQR